MKRPDSGIKRQWNATSLRYQGRWPCPFPPTQALACFRRTSHPRLFTRLLILIRELFFQGLLWISNVARLWSATGPGWLTCAESIKMRGATRQLELKE